MIQRDFVVLSYSLKIRLCTLMSFKPRFIQYWIMHCCVGFFGRLNSESLMILFTFCFMCTFWFFRVLRVCVQSCITSYYFFCFSLGVFICLLLFQCLFFMQFCFTVYTFSSIRSIFAWFHDILTTGMIFDTSD